MVSCPAEGIRVAAQAQTRCLKTTEQMEVNDSSELGCTAPSTLRGSMVLVFLLVAAVVCMKCVRIVQELDQNEIERSEELKECTRLRFVSTPEDADFLLSVSSPTYEWEDHSNYAVLRQFQIKHDLNFFCMPLLSDMLYSDVDIQAFAAAGRRTKYGILCFDPQYQNSADPVTGHVCMRDLAFTAQNPGRAWTYFPSVQSNKTWLQEGLDDKIRLALDNAYFQISSTSSNQTPLAPNLQRLVQSDQRWFQLGMTRVADVAPGQTGAETLIEALPKGPSQQLSPPAQVVYVHLCQKALAPASVTIMCLQRKLPRGLVGAVMHYLQASYYVHLSRPGEVHNAA